MAARKASGATPDSAVPSFAVEVAEEPMPKRERASKPNPLIEHVQKAVASGNTMQVSVDGVDQRKEVHSYLRRAAQALNVGVRVVDDGKYVKFATKSKVSRKYTSEQIREWSRTQDGVESVPDGVKIPEDVRTAFKVEHGFIKAVSK